MDKGFLESCLTQGMSLSQIGARVARDRSTIGYWVRKHGLRPNGQAKHAAIGGLPRETLEALVDKGISQERMAMELGCSPSTVRHWLTRYGLATSRARSRESARAARAAGMTEFTATCPEHGETDFVIDGRGRSRCARCRADAVSRWRRRAKRRLIQAAGGACALCGYSKYQGALQFHHVDPGAKSFLISRGGVTRSFAELEREAEKCVLLCANCHAEVEGGIAALPARRAKVIEVQAA